MINSSFKCRIRFLLLELTWVPENLTESPINKKIHDLKLDYGK